jgi:hypothetical protein
MVPELSYDHLDGINNGFMAMNAWTEAVSVTTTEERRIAIRQQLLSYCGLDTLALVRIWKILSGR